MSVPVSVQNCSDIGEDIVNAIMGKTGIKKRVKQVNKLDELPEDLRNFIDGIMIKESEVQVPNRRPRKKKEVVVREDPRKKLVNSRVFQY